MLKIRLMRIGGRQRPFYRVVAVDERAKRTGAYIELLGTYNPLTEPKEIKLKQDRIDHWVKQGAQMSDGFLRIIGKAPQRPPRKPKKSVQATGDSGQVKTAEPKKEETATEETAQANSPEVDIATAEPIQNNTEKIATEPAASRNDEGIVESATKNERPA